MTDETRFLCVYCGSSMGGKPVYAEAARRVGTALGNRGFGLVYGGGRVGLMGVVADAVLDAGGRVVGVIPTTLKLKEIAHDTLSELHVVTTMHERKAMMAERASGFLTLPGGIGTFEEFFETLTWAALGIHAKPIGILNVDGYFDPLLRLLDHAVAEKFVRAKHLDLIHVSDDPEQLAEKLLHAVPPDPGPIYEDLGSSGLESTGR